MSEEEPTGAAVAVAEDGGEVADAAVLRRVRWVAAAYGVVGGAAFALAGGVRRGLVLTLASAVSIVALRSLEGVVRRLRAPVGPGSRADPPPAGLGVAYPFRLLLLIVLVILVAALGRDPLALALGLSAVPLAVLVEAGRQVVAIDRRLETEDENRTGDDGADS